MSNLLHQSAHLLAFVRAVEAGSFSAASRITGSTPSAISKGVAKLEAELGVKLFRRSTRSLTLTSEGRVFFDRVAPLLRELDDSADAIRPHGAARGRIRVSMPSDLGRLMLGSLSRNFLRKHKELELDLVLVDRLVDVVSEGFDLVFRVGHLSASDLNARTLADLEMVLVASPACLMEHGRPTSIAELRELPFVRYLMRGRSYPITFSDQTTFVPEGPIGVDTGSALREAVLRGIGVAYLMKCTVQDDIDNGSLVQVLPRHPLPSLPLQAVHAFGRLTPARVKLITDFVGQEIRRLTAAASRRADR
jgi:DNA-binding transcriptional LysR family regulator